MDAPKNNQNSPTTETTAGATPQTWQTSAQYVQQRDVALAAEQAKLKDDKNSARLRVVSIIYACFLVLLLVTTFTDFLAIQPPAGVQTEGRDYWAAADPVQGIALIGATIFGITASIIAIASKKKNTRIFGITLLSIVATCLPIAAFMLLLTPCIFSLSPCYIRGS